MIIGLQGYAQSGKDTVGAHLVAKHGFQRYSFADFMRSCLYTLNPYVRLTKLRRGGELYRPLSELVDQYGWEKTKLDHDDVRRLLQRFGTDVGRNMLGEDIWVQNALATLSSGDWVVTDVRFPNEVGALRYLGARMWRIVRPGYGPVNAHESDNQELDFDVQIPNTGTLEELYSVVDRLL